MGADTLNLRALQRDHNLILLTAEEYHKLRQVPSLPLPERHEEHFNRVLRRRSEWPALVGDGNGKICRTRIKDGSIHRDTAAEEIEVPPPPRRLKLVQAWVKQKALAMILQKAAEIGASEIVLVDSDFSQPHSEKAARIEAILENSCMQAFNPVKPKVSYAGKLTEIAFNDEAVFFGDLAGQSALSAIERVRGKSAVFINGPEGGFSAGEAAFLGSRATGILLSENVLRSESAAIIALGLLRLAP